MREKSEAVWNRVWSEFCNAMLILATLSTVSADAAPIPVTQLQRAEAVSFEKEILPILQKNCLACHSTSEKQGDLVLESPQGILKGGDSGPAVVPGRGADSLLLKVASHQQDPVMPPSGNDVAASNLSSAELGLLKLWIDQGARGEGGVATLSPQKWQPLPPGINPVQAIALTDDGQYVAASRANQIFLYHVPTGSLVTRLSDPALDQTLPASSGSVVATGIAHRDLVQSLALNADGDLLASGGFREVKLWRRPRDVTRFAIDLKSPGTAAAVSPDKQWIAVATADHHIHLYKAASGEPGAVLTGHSAEISSLKFTPEGQYLLSGSHDQTVRQWAIPEGVPAGMVETPSPVNAIELVNTAEAAADQPLPPQWLVTGHADRQLRVWTRPSAVVTKTTLSASTIERTITSEDGSLMAIIDAEGTVRILPLEHTESLPPERELAKWSVTGGVTAAAFVRLPGSPDFTAESPLQGRVLATGSADGMIRLWNLSDQKLLREFRGDAMRVTALAASMDGKFLTSGLESGAMTQWSLESALQAIGNEPAIQPPQNVNVAFTVLSPSRKLLAIVGSREGQHVVDVHNLESRQHIATFNGHTAAIRSLAFTGNESQLVTGGDDKSIRMWNLQAPGEAVLIVAEQLPSAVTAIGANGDGSQVLAGFADHALKLFNPRGDTPESKFLNEFPGHTGQILATGFYGGQLYSVAADQSVRFWNSSDGSQIRSFNLPTAITTFAISGDGQRMAFGGSDHQLRIAQTDNGNVLHTLNGFTEAITCVGFSSDSQRLSVLTSSGELSLWSLSSQRLLEAAPRTGLSFVTPVTEAIPLVATTVQGVLTIRQPAFLRQFEGNTQSVTDLLYHPNGQTVFVVATDGTLRGYNTANAQQTFAIGHGAKVHDLAMSADGNVLATAGENAQVRLWNTSGGGSGPQQLSGYSGPVTRVAFSADGTRVFATVGGEQPSISVHDFQSGQLLERCVGSADIVDCHVLKGVSGASENEPHRQLLLVGATSGEVRGLSYLRTVQGHGDTVNSLAQIPDAPRQILSGSSDGTIRRWNLDNGQALQQFNHGGAVVSIAVRADGQRFASASNNQTTKLFNINGQQLAEMRGDVRRRIDQTRAQQRLNAASARLNVAKQQLQQAEQDLPTKTNAEKSLAENLEKSNREVIDKQAALDKAAAEKLAAEKSALEATTMAKSALAEKAAAEKAAQIATTAMQVAQTTMQRLQQAANGDPNNEKLKLLVAQAVQDVDRCQQESQSATAAIQTPTQKAQEMASLANTAAQKVSTAQKPYSEALTALKTAQANQNLLSQQQALSAQELKVAQELVPIRKESVIQAEAAQQAAQKALELANTAFQESNQPIHSVAFSPDGATLLTAGDFASAHLWDAEAGTALSAFAAHTAPLHEAVFVDDNSFLTISEDQSARLWEVRPEWKLERTIGAIDDPQTIAHRVTAVDFNADATQLLIAGGVPSRSGELQVIHTADGHRELYLPQAHDDVIYSAQFSPDGRRIASGGADKYLRTFDLGTSQQLRRFEGHTSHVLGIAWKGDGQVISTAGADNTVKVWDAETADQQRTIDNPFTRHVTSIQYIGESDSIVTSCGDKLVRMHNASNGGLERNFGDIQVWPHCVACTPDRSIVVAGDAEGTITIWNGQNGQLLRKLTSSAQESP